ncbi:hypothetical protein H2204_008477 [Knufia peltigerae]|uniref:Uncharacterized protein n=1 Tax=Knufia peltigerae TaxID=1002370 RepID=A0AA39CWT0_9EURO|nr:hypothetical protein H2204_008477 [Knufia peltigerae]
MPSSIRLELNFAVIAALVRGISQWYKLEHKQKASGTADHGSKPSAENVSKKRNHGETEPAKVLKGPHPNKRAKTEVHDRSISRQSSFRASNQKHEPFETNIGQSSYPRIEFLVQRYGSVPLSDTELEEPLSPKPETIMSLLLKVLFSSTRISHELAAKTIASHQGQLP